MTRTTLSQLLRSTIRRDPIAWAHACKIDLRPYQRQIALAIKESIIHKLGLTFVIVLPRQSGKNELQAHLFSWLLFRYANEGGRIVSVSPTFKPQTLNNMDRVKYSLDKCIGSRGLWKSSKGYMYQLGNARLQFFSGEPRANVVGATADLLLSVDEAQSISPAKFDKDFDPMTASTNATRVFWGTAWTSDTLLERERRAAQQASKLDGVQRVFYFTADDVRRLVPAYGIKVDNLITALGRNHPLIRTQYFCESIDSQSAMFNPARLMLIESPSPDPASGFEMGRASGCAFLIDVAGQDESKFNTHQFFDLGLGNPGRDSTALTIVEIDLSSLEMLNKPTYHVVARHSWVGENHLSIFGKLKNLSETWHPAHIVMDATVSGKVFGHCSTVSFLRASLRSNSPSRKNPRSAGVSSPSSKPAAFTITATPTKFICNTANAFARFSPALQKPCAGEFQMAPACPMAASFTMISSSPMPSQPNSMRLNGLSARPHSLSIRPTL